MKKSNLLFFTFLLLTGGCSTSEKNNNTSTSDKPNILFIMLDDLGFSDLGCYGSEISTPNIDAIAASGQRFSGFRTAPMCGPSRAMFISGNTNHIEGMGRMINADPKNARYKGMEYYEEDISDRIVAFPKLLQKAGYTNSVVGKWHLGWADSSLPFNHGFDNSWVSRNAVNNYYLKKNYGFSTPNKIDTISYFFSGGKPAEYPEGTYITEWYTDKMIEFLKKDKKEKSDQPFFAFVSYTAPHWPLQVPQEFWDRNKGKYDDGYQALMEKRVNGLKEKGILPKEIEIPAYPDLKNWDDLTADEKRYEARKMEIFAGMVENVDYHIGRIIQHLKDSGQYENTIIIVQSDNGAAAEEISKSKILGPPIMAWNDNSYENMNQPNSFIALGKNWAQVSSAPFRKYKQKMFEGSMASPFIIAGKGFPKSNKVRTGFFTIQDLAPTFLEIAGTSYPSEWKGKSIVPQRGVSALSFLQQNTSVVHDKDFIFGIEHRRSAFIRKGNWKIINQADAANNDLFQLYNLENDFSEQKNLAKEAPQKLAKMIQEWEKYKKENGVKFLAKMK